MLPLIKRAVVEQNHWMTDDEFIDVVALSQSLPGLIAVNMAIFTGYRACGTKGSIIATIGSILPPFIIILLIASLFNNFKDNATINAIFTGIRPVTVALIAVPTIQLAMKSKLTWFTGSMAVVTTLLIALLKVSPIYILLTVAVCAVSIQLWNEKNNREEMK